ncbi:uncharacterized protein LOC141633971 [Silene latifolia]|uniref:uncharacterized protein LOC141633971 n=1 Tax=Silene latifolia TaxID=37657 RepID=UPI003D77FF39
MPRFRCSGKAVWMDLQNWLSKLEAPFFIIGYFNQLEFHEDKLGGDTGKIFGASYFSEWKTRNLLSDIVFKGPKFTWCNNRKGNSCIYERIDKALGSLDWCSFYPSTGITHLPIQCLDHAPIILDTELFGIKKRKSYKVEAWCLDYDECSIVSREWCKTDRGSPTFRVLCKLKRVRRVLKNWTLKKRIEWHQKWTDFDDKLASELEGTFHGNDEEAYDNCHVEYLEFNKAASLFWKQRAKVHWLQEGDACTKFFFNSVKERYNKNLILGIKGDGTWCFDEKDINSTFGNYFMDLFETNLDHDSFETYLAKHRHLFVLIKHKLHSDKKDSLSKPFIRKKVRTAVFQMGSNKSSGPDGMPAIFFQKYWCHIKNEVTNVVLSILNTGNVPKELNRTSVVLIPKTNCPETVRDYRPISLCNVIMKIVTKCISNRMKTYMPHLVGEYQNGFIPGQSISDNILLSHELFHHITRKSMGKNGLMALKIDMSKAYDRIKWNFLRATLLFMGFSLHIIQLIMLLLYAQDKRLIHGIKLSRSTPPISHLLFAADSIFFLHADSNSCQALKDNLSSYCGASGHQIYDAKSSITFSPNSTMHTTRNCIKILKVVANRQMGLYLGIFTDFGRTKKEIFALVSGKVRKRIHCWNNIFLSPAGRLTLICSVLSSVPLFSLSAFRMPVGWRILHNEESLLSRVLGSKMGITRSNLMSNSGFLKGNLSWGGRGILWGVQLLVPNLVWQVGFPSSLDVWTDKWIHGRSLANLYSLSTDSLAIKPRVHVSQLQTREGDWDLDRVLQVCRHDAIPFILFVSIPREDEEDHIFWSLTPNGKYSVKSGYRLAFASLWASKASATVRLRMNSDSVSFCHKRLWSLCIPRKWKVFLWKIFSNSLPTGEEALKRRLTWNHHCQACHSELNKDANDNISVEEDKRIRIAMPIVKLLEDQDEAFLIRSHFPHTLIGDKICYDHIQIKCDASWKSNFKSSASWVFQDGKDANFHFGQRNFWARTPFQAEARALLLAVSDVVSQGYRHIDATTDCMNLALQVNGVGDPCQDVAPLI